MADCDSAFNLRVTPDRLAVVLDCVLPQDDFTPLLDRIETELEALKLAQVPPRTELLKILQEASEEGGSAKALVLVHGEPPSPPRDAVIEWAQDFFNSGFAVDDVTGSIDYRRRIAQPQVAKDQLLAKIIPAEDGEPGRDVFGQTVPVRKPRRVRIRSGQNVRVEEDGNVFYATADGRIRWEANGLSVDQVYVISGSVGLETGHVRHPGAVIIEEDVLSESEIEAAGDIDVQGVVEASSIRSGGRLSVRGGITATKECLITVSLSIHAKFILEAHVEAGDNIVIEREIMHSHLKTRGAVSMPRGRLVGGVTEALGGIDVGQAGSDALVPTTLVVGSDYQLKPLLAEYEEKIKELESSLKKVRTTAEPYRSRLDRLPPERKEALVRLLEKGKEMQETLKSLQEEVDQITAESRERAKPEVLIRERLYPDTVIRIGRARLRIRDTFEGPIRAILSEGEVVLQNVATRETS